MWCSLSPLTGVVAADLGEGAVLVIPASIHVDPALVVARSVAIAAAGDAISGQRRRERGRGGRDGGREGGEGGEGGREGGREGGKMDKEYRGKHPKEQVKEMGRKEGNDLYTHVQLKQNKQ